MIVSMFVEHNEVGMIQSQGLYLVILLLWISRRGFLGIGFLVVVGLEYPVFFLGYLLNINDLVNVCILDLA